MCGVTLSSYFEAALFGRHFIACSVQARVDGSASCRSGEFWGVVHVQHAQVNLQQNYGPLATLYKYPHSKKKNKSQKQMQTMLQLGSVNCMFWRKN